MDLQSLYQLFLSGCGISTDSRHVKKGDIFFALKGENFDGNQYALQSLQNGAVLAVTDDQQIPDHPALFKVLDVLDTLQHLEVFMKCHSVIETGKLETFVHCRRALV